MSAIVPFNDLSRVAPDVRSEMLGAIGRVVDGGRYVLGECVSTFERNFAAYCGVRWCVGTGNGTDALEIALRAVGIGAGDRVLHVANAGFYGSTALRAIGAIPVFIDVDLETRSIDASLLGVHARDPGIKGALVTHLYGRLAPVADVLSVLEPLGIPLIEDCAQAHGARSGDRAAGSFGLASAFSFYPTKNLGGIGDAGAVLTNDETVARNAASLRQYGWGDKYKVERAGGKNSRLDEIQAAVLDVRLRHLDAWNRRRREIAHRYRSGIAHPAVICPPQPGENDCAHLFVIRCPRRDALAKHLALNGIATDIHYPLPDYRQATMNHGYSLPITERLAQEVLSLPCFPGLTDIEVDRVIAAVNEWADECIR